MRSNINILYRGGMRTLLLISLVVITGNVLAVKDGNVMPFIAGWFKPSTGTVYDTIRHTSYLAAIADSATGNFRSDKPGVRQSVTTISLLISSDVPCATGYDVTLKGFCKKISQTGARDSVPFTLQVNYNPGAGTNYKQRDAISINNSVHALVVATITVNGTTITDTADNRFRVEVSTIGDLVYPPPSNLSLTESAPIFNIINEDATARNIKWSWAPLPWAEYYELEYLHVDDYKADGTRKERSSLRYNFRTDAVRVRVNTNEYELPLVFEQGYLVARVRAVGFKGRDFSIPVYGNWNLNDEGTIPATGNSVFEIPAAKAHEADRLNWQYVAGFNESGLRSEAVTYADGTLRARQQVTALPEENKLLVTETFYDHQGRPAIITLPAPIKPSATTFTPPPPYNVGGPTGIAPSTITLPKGTTNQFQNIGGPVNLSGTNFSNTLNTGFSLPTGFSPTAINNLQQYLGNFELNNYLGLFWYQSQNARIGFVPRFNVNQEGRNILRNQYDVGKACDSASVAFGTQSGAGRYYSPANPEQSRWQAYVPDAEGYPYAQVKYSNDGTGKIRESSKPGFAFRMGGGRTQKYFYGTPSQAELDRYFGNDAGRSSFYKKTLMIDENGQAHVSIHNLKGNVVLSAMAGAKPENLEAISGVTTVNDTIDLIAENNVLNTSENAWISTKRIVLAASTDVQLSYRTSTPDYAGRYCNSTPFCFDCIYDLEIIVTDGCGNTRYEHRQTIGNLENISTCSNFEATPATTIRLDQGNYTIIKKLKVNEASIEAYVNQFTERFTCRADTLLFTPDVDAACNPDCITCNVENVTAGFLRREGGSANISYIKRKSGNNSACQLACTQTGLGEVAMAFQTMLSEVSPGGQYAEYRDTTDEALRPTGIIDPSKFPLSVLNDANQLPLRNATWRTPAFNYQTKTGETAYVEIDAEGLPAHRSPASEIVRRDGKQFVLVKYLNDVSEFIRLWEPQWAEALVVYHPEYEYYQWCVRNSASFRFDSLMVATEKYSDAAAQHLTDFRNDPLFPASSATLRADMEMRLANFSSIAGTPVSAAQMAILSVHCGNPNFTDAQLRDCYSSKTLYATPGAQDKEWLVYKGLYRKTKLRVLSNERNRFVTAAGGFNNRTIGGTRDVAANSLYAGKRRVFKEEDDVNDELELDFAGEEPTLTEVQELYNRITKQRYADCGICPIGSDLVMLLNALSYDKKLTAANVTLPGLSPLVLTKNIVNSFSNNTALQYSWSRINDPNPNILKAKITTGGVDMGTLTLQKRKADIVWDSLFILDCFKPTGNYTFTLRIIDNNGKADTVQGISNCFRLNDCTFNRSCTATPARKEMLTFLQYLFEANRYRRSALTVHTAASNSPFFGLALRAIHPRGQTWEWAFGGFTSTANTSFNAQLRISEGRGALTASPAICEFAFRVITPGFSFDSLGFIIAVRKPASLPSSALVNDAELMVRSKGGRVFYIAMSNSCYSLFNCPGNLTNATLRPAMCCSPTPRMGPVPNNCEASLRLIARREVERDFETRKAMAVDSMRSAYIRHCLNSVQEKLTVAYNDAMYMATLYYYDLSGALVKTVPPKGVRTLTNAQIVACRNHRDNSSRPAVYPSHVLATTYSYTSFGAVAEKTSPDEGTVKYAYDFAGRTILSRNAEQAANNYASYIRYDANNRIIESGRTNYSGTWQTFKDYSAHTGTLSGLAEVTQTNYDEPSALASYFSLGGGQKRLRNRPSSVSYKMNGSTDAYVAAYSYDALGNVTRMVQHYPALGLSGANAVKTVDYNFDKLSGQITRIVYQQGKEDQFIHWLSYDANKRVTQVHTSKSEYIPERLRDADATFYYYQHGPLARIEIGNEKIQGVDYAYTIQGWLKGINSYTTGNGNLDMGKDGTEEGSLHAAGFPKDVTAELLNYFPNDYKKIGAEGAPFYPESPLSVLNSGFSKPLYNGNIQNSMMSVLHGFSGDAYKTFAQAYSYDQANRIRQSKMLFATESGFESAFSEQYKMSVDYDLNGNITSLTRSGNSATLFDNLTYKYNQPEQNNRLHQITDIGSSGAADLKNQTNTNNYGYDAIGRLVSDISEGISNIQYNNQSKVTAVNKAGNNTTYAYDAFGRRISKTVNGATEWYVNDALGNPMAIYSINGSEVRWKEATIYGGKRMGVYKHDVQLAVPGITHNVMRDSLIRGNKRYELANHIGDVLAVVSDRKVSTPDGFAAEVQAAHNYYPFGMTMPGRTFGNDEYRYGFQGMESEDNLRGENNSYTTEFRQYDPRVGRWMSVDPKADKYANLSPYNALFNNPISITDPLGNDPPVKKTFEQSMNELPTTGTGPDDPIAMGEDLSFLDGDKEVSERPRHRRHPTVRTPETPSTFSFPEPAGDLLAGAPIAVYDFEDDHVHGRRSTGSSTSPSTTPPPPGEDWERDVRIVREALGNAGTVMDVGGVVSDGVSIYEMTREGLSIREGADVLMRGSRTVGGMSLLGAGISTANMVGDIWDDANALVDGDIGTGTYVGRSALNITSGVVGCVPVVGVVGSRALGAFRDWALPRPAH